MKRLTALVQAWFTLKKNQNKTKPKKPSNQLQSEQRVDRVTCFFKHPSIWVLMESILERSSAISQLKKKKKHNTFPSVALVLHPTLTEKVSQENQFQLRLQDHFTQSLNFLLHHSNLNLTHTSESKSCPCSVPQRPLPPFLQDEPYLFNKGLCWLGCQGKRFSSHLGAVGFPCSPLLFLLYKEKKAYGTPDPHLITI